MAELYLNRPLFPGTTEADQLTRILTVLGTPTKEEWSDGYAIALSKNINLPVIKAPDLKSHFSKCSDISAEAIDLMKQMFKFN